MNKKHLIIGSTLVLLVAMLLFLLLSSSSNITDTNKQNELKEAFDLDIIVNLENFTSKSHNEEKVLDVAMQLANKKGLISEFSDDTTYIEYAPQNEIHQIITELTGITVEAPIELEDSYYLFDSENEYYYCRPAMMYYYYISKINSLEKNNNTYTFYCAISREIDAEIETIDNVIIKVTEMLDNTLVKYRVEEVKFN